MMNETVAWTSVAMGCLLLFAFCARACNEDTANMRELEKAKLASPVVTSCVTHTIGQRVVVQ